VDCIASAAAIAAAAAVGAIAAAAAAAVVIVLLHHLHLDTRQGHTHKAGPPFTLQRQQAAAASASAGSHGQKSLGSALQLLPLLYCCNSICLSR
jgi:hypothetical protein